LSVFFDAPHLLPQGWRLSAYLGREQHLATPYYGLGNETSRNESAEEPPNPYFYRYGRTGIRLNTDVQRSIAGPLRVLVGGGFRTTKIDMTPFDSGSTLIMQEYAGFAFPDDRASTWRTGLVYDTRDRETGPTRGQWIEGLYQHGSKSSRPDGDFERLTGSARVYVSLTDRLVWAQRLVAQNVSGTVEFYDLFAIQNSYKDDEGLGGSGTLRGLPKNRFIGRGVLFANEELRWRASDFRLRGRESAVILSGFLDAGRVWYRGISMDGILSDYHVGFGGGVRLRYGPNFVVALDVAHSKEATPIYIGLGYPF
jgi:outer membrane protein assembly factor BamA